LDYWSGTYDGKVLWMNPRVLDRDRAFDRTESFTLETNIRTLIICTKEWRCFLSAPTDLVLVTCAEGVKRLRFDTLQTISQKEGLMDSFRHFFFAVHVI